MSDEEELGRFRKQIDRIDGDILRLISERAQCAQSVAKIKQSAAQQMDAVFYRPEREAQVLREVMQHNTGPLDDSTVAVLFREIMSACLALEQTLQVAYLGPEGTFTQSAVTKHFGHAAQMMPLGAIDEIFRAVETDAARFGVVPVENSTEGVINHTLDMFMRSALKICGEVVIRIHHNLVGSINDVSKVKKVLSHQQSLAQCRYWLDVNLPNAERETVSSNAEAARLVSGSNDMVAIAPAAAAEIYQLNTLAAQIEDEPDNTTRFLIIGRQGVPPSGDDKTSLLISARNKPGALFHLLQPLADNGISMTRIESRPSRGGLWEYVFFVDIEGHKDDDNIAPALDRLADEAALFRVLGAYPKAAY
jgi:chorismate mutase/prephenate dehydratase